MRRSMHNCAADTNCCRRLVQVLRPRFDSEQGTFDACAGRQRAGARRGHARRACGRVRHAPVASLAMAEQVLAGLLGASARAARAPPKGPSSTASWPSDVAELAAIEQQLVFARQLFNAAALSYNQAVHQFPTSMLAPLFRFGRRAAMSATLASQAP